MGDQQQQEGGGRQERGRRPIRARAGRAARRNPPPTDRAMARAASRPPRRLVGRPERQRPSKSERSQSERADVHGSGVGALSHVQRGAPRCTTPTNSAATCVRLSRATRRLVRDAKIHHPHPTSAPACVRACALCALCSCAARRAQRRGAPPLRVARVRASADSRAPRRGGGERGTGTYYHPTATEIHVRAYIRVSSWVVRLARCTPPRSCSSASHDRADRAATHLDEAGGRRGGAPSLQLQRGDRSCYASLRRRQ